MKDIESIKIGLENCQSLEIPSKYIIACRFSGYRREVTRVACNAISEINYYDNVILMLDNKISELKFVPDFEDDNLFERDDIVNFTLTYSDRTSETYLVPWGEDDYINEYQHIEKNDSDDILIYVTKDLNNIADDVNECKSFFYNLDELNRIKSQISDY